MDDIDEKVRLERLFVSTMTTRQLQTYGTDTIQRYLVVMTDCARKPLFQAALTNLANILQLEIEHTSEAQDPNECQDPEPEDPPSKKKKVMTITWTNLLEHLYTIISVSTVLLKSHLDNYDKAQNTLNKYFPM